MCKITIIVERSNHSRGGITASVALQYANRNGLTGIPIRESRFSGTATNVQDYAKKQRLEEGKISQADYDNQVAKWQRGQVLLNSIASGLSAPTDSTAGIVAATASPALSYQIGQHFKEKGAEGTGGHILAHTLLGGAVAAAGGNDPLAGALSAGTAEAAAPVISRWLYGEPDGSKLNAEQKETVTAITSLLGTATGAAVGGSSADAAQGSLNAQNAVENNALETAWDIANIGIGLTSFGYNISQGNYGSAALDAAGLIYDGTATAIPFLPAGASATIKARRAGNSIVQSVEIGKDVADATKAANQAAKNSKNITSIPSTTGTKIHRETGELLGESKGTATKLSNSANSYFKGANKGTGPQPDLSWKGSGVWTDLTTPQQWGAHTRKYNQTHGQGIPIFYKAGEGVINYKPLKSGAGLLINGSRAIDQEINNKDNK